MKKLLSLLLAGTMLFSLAACGEETEEKEKSKNKNNHDIVEDGGFVADEKDFSDADFTNTQVGDYITFGSYEQDRNKSNGKEEIEWLVLDKQDDKILVISKYILDLQPYNSEREDVTWETCTLRNWLNEEFINEAFTSKESSRIPVVTVTADASSRTNTDPGNDTQDKVFLLSIDEAKEYFDSDSARECKPTTYVVAQGVYESESDDGNSWWWLRSIGYSQHSAAYVSSNGDITNSGDYVERDYAAVRPAMWIEL